MLTGSVSARNYRLLDLSRSFSELDEGTEVFIDSYHFADLGNRLVAQALADQIDWRSITPSAAVMADQSQSLGIVSFEPTAWRAGKPFKQQSDGTSLLRIVPSRFNNNLLVVFDRSILPTAIGKDALTASIPPSLYATKGEHSVYVVDGA